MTHIDNPWLADGNPEIVARHARRDGAGHELGTYEASSPGPTRGTVLLIHENRGIDAYVEQVADGLASHGLQVVVPDLLSRLGGSPSLTHPGGEPPSPREIDPDTHLADLGAVLDQLTAEDAPVVTVGFCFGGEVAWRLAVRRSNALAGLAAVYGVGPAPADVARLTCPVLGIYADDDTRVNAGIPELWPALDDLNVPVSIHRYGGTLHAFHNHHRPDRYHPSAAAAAWAILTGWTRQAVGA